MVTNNSVNYATGASGTVLTGNGVGVTPTFQTPTSGGFTTIATQIFTSSGTYTPTSGMKWCTVECQGPGGDGGTPSSTTWGAGGGAGGYSIKSFSAATIGASKTITVVPGAGGYVEFDPGGLSLNALGGTSGNDIIPGTGGGATNGSINSNGGSGCVGYTDVTTAVGGTGGGSYFGGGSGGAYADGSSVSSAMDGGAGCGGCGGATAVAGSTGPSNGVAGFILITEFI